jgi:hypothetical protein
MRSLRLAGTILTITALGAAGLSAQGKSGTAGANGHGNGNGRGTSQKPSTATSPASTANGGAANGKPAATPATHGGGANAKPKGTSTAAPVSSSATNTPTAGTTTGTTGTGTTTTPPNALTTKLSSKPQQLSRIKAMLPDGMTLNEATTGFRNQGQFIAALEASLNQHVSFADLQEAMTVKGLSLGQAVKQLKAAPTTTSTGTTTGTRAR